MAKKITLTVNESLFSKIDQWRSSFNLSKVFQDAVSEAIKAKEEFHRMLSGKADIPQIVERLKAEKRAWLDTARQEGVLDGGAWASRAHYKELVSTLALLNEIALETTVSIAGPAAENQSIEIWQRKGNLSPTGSPDHTDAVQAYKDGWRAGVRGLWDMVKDQIDD